jgi:hypothetical protein
VDDGPCRVWIKLRNPASRAAREERALESMSPRRRPQMDDRPLSKLMALRR